MSETRSGSRLPWLIAVAVFAGFGLAGPYKMATRDDGGGGGSGGAGGEPLVRMAGLRFSPASLVVKRGTSVRFLNDDVAPHTVTATDNSVDSGTLRPGAGEFRITINQRFSYFCAIHPSMTATVEIEA